MRRHLAAALAMGVTSGCHSSSSSSMDTQPVPSASASVGAAPSSMGALRRPTVPSPPGAICDPVKDSAVCSPDGTTQQSCSMGRWQTVFACDGPEGCKGRGDKLVCDVKRPVNEGDPCTMGINPPRCNNSQDLMACVFGKWKKTTCSAPGKCLAATMDMPAGCRVSQ